MRGESALFAIGRGALWVGAVLVMLALVFALLAQPEWFLFTWVGLVTMAVGAVLRWTGRRPAPPARA